MPERKLLPPTSYQGGKQFYASLIINQIINNELIYPEKNEIHFYDLCCGSGAIFLEMMNRGLAPTNITVLDS
jgi:methylase of polypeptide subunit release factors